MKFISLIALLGLIAACGPDNPTPGSLAGSAPDASPARPDSGVDPGTLPDAGNCGEQTESIELISLGDPPDMLIVLDCSNSMGPTETLPLPMLPLSNWQMMEQALTELTNARESNIRFGFTVFPTHESCGVNPGADVNPDLGTASDIQAAIASYDTSGGTPMWQAVVNAGETYASLPPNAAGQYVLLATDGAAGCGDNGSIDADDATVQAVAALHSQGIDTFVLGIGLANPFEFGGVLNEAAEAGGHPRAGSTKYYRADDSTSLVAALDEIAGGIIVPGCEWELATTPPDPELVTVTANGSPVPRSTAHTNGWDYHPDASTITFFGSSCTDIEEGLVDEVDFVWGCPGPQID